MEIRVADKRLLTDRALKALKPAAPGKRAILWDAACPGLAVRVTDKGRRSFYVIGRAVGDRRLLNHFLGSYPAMSLAEAREAAPKVLMMMTRGHRPKDLEALRRGHDDERRRREARDRAENFAATAEIFVNRHIEGKKLRSGREMTSIVRRDLTPQLGEKSMSQITRHDVLAVIEGILDQRGPHAARHAFAVLRKMFNWAIERGLIDRSPCDGLKGANLHGSPSARDRVLSDDELWLVWHAAGLVGYPFGPLIRLLALTGQRRDEVAELRWSEVDLTGGLLTIPAERMKSKIAHVVPLAPAAHEIVRDLPRFSAGDFIFTTTGGSRPVSGFSKMKLRLDRTTSKLAEDAAVRMAPWRLHDLRRSARTGMAAAGVLPFIGELVIGHRQTGVHAVYDLHSYDDQKLEALARWEARLLSIVRRPGPTAPPEPRHILSADTHIPPIAQPTPTPN